MAEIIDVVTRINYEADRKPIDDATKSLDNTINAAENAQKRLKSLQEAFNKTAEGETVRRERLAGLIGRQIKLLDQYGNSVGKTLATDRKVQASLDKNVQKFNSLRFSIGNLVRDAPSFANGIATGFLAIGNNIGPAFDDIIQRIKVLRAEGKSAGLIFKDIGGALFGFSGILNIVVLALTLFGDKLFNTEEAADGVINSLDDLSKKMSQIDRQAREGAAKEITDLRLLEATATNTANSQELRVAAARKMLELYPELNKQTNQEAILNGQAANAINAVADALINKSLAAAAGRKIDVLADADLGAREKEVDITNRLIAARREFNTLNAAADASGNQYARNAAVRAAERLKSLEDEKKQVRELRTGITGQQRDLLSYQQQQQSLAASVLGVDALIDTKEDKNTGKPSRIKKVSEEAKEADDQVRILQNSIKEVLDLANESLDRMPQFRTFALPTPANKEDTKKQVDFVDTLRRSYNSLASAIQTVISLYQMQDRVLDVQYANQSRRVEDARILAERGNIAAYNAERERLEQLGRDREESAQKQAQLNAIISASNAAVSLTEATKGILSAGATTAAQGGGVVGYVAGIAAAFAAVASLYASIKSLDSFKDGVVDYKGLGTGTSDSNIVRLSAGESVITAANTKKFRPLLEDIHTGRIADMSHIGNRYTFDTKKMEDGIAEVAEAVKTTQTKVSARVDQDGVAIITERYRHKQKRLRG